MYSFLVGRVLRLWLPVAFTATMLCGLVELAMQQEIRLAANNPQVQMAEDAAAALETGGTPERVIPAQVTDIAQSLHAFLIVYDNKGKPLSSSARLNNHVPVPPVGVFNSVRTEGEERVTWEPQPGIRIAAVMERVGSPNPGFVLAGRSLREVEARETMLLLEVGIAWLASVVGSLLLALFVHNRP